MHFRIGALHSGVSVISNSPTYALIRLSLALVAMFAVGFYWLATKDRPTRRHATVAPSPPHSAAGPRFLDVGKFDEWKAFAPYPDPVVHAAHEATAESGDSHPPFSQREEAPTHLLGPRLATTCNNAIESLTREPDKPDKPDPAPAKTTAPSSPNSAIRCPRCLSSRIDTRNRAFKAGSTIGSVAGQRADFPLLYCHGPLAIRGATGSALQAFVPESSRSHGLIAIRVDHKYVHACLHEHAWRKWGI
ncbi:hypothetical protein L0Z11_10750 [Burkholderia multivorans]|uniref:hypothetical protein n=1 Tax=Burkholderia multivorans TaxID=87883 RepID=UPI002019546E|nr:hypothetical protein [Burkholderia multivorans]UQN68170.1 hypothetical protein L0Z45_10770 [Burkholderia multivorans]UQN73899.1 hypothetical protein L0Z11_10750 [Burkholderia multivorans]